LTDAYKSREPRPYWPDRGNSQMTCKTSVVRLVVAAVSVRPRTVLRTKVEDKAGSAGMVRQRKYRRRLGRVAAT